MRNNINCLCIETLTGWRNEHLGFRQLPFNQYQQSLGLTRAYSLWRYSHSPPCFSQGEKKGDVNKNEIQFTIQCQLTFYVVPYFIDMQGLSKTSFYNPANRLKYWYANRRFSPRNCWNIISDDNVNNHIQHNSDHKKVASKIHQQIYHESHTLIKVGLSFHQLKLTFESNKDIADRGVEGARIQTWIQEY